jgi:hypothetical protein
MLFFQKGEVFMSFEHIRESYKIVGEKLVELGYCSSFKMNMANGKFSATFTQSGEKFRRQFRQIHEAVSSNDIETEKFREDAILAIFVDEPHSPGHFFSPKYP